MIRVGAVVQRYGDGVVGGAETLARDVCERLNASGFDVTVFTTTARDYITWENEFAAGESILRGVRILRFPVAEQRNISSFNRFSEAFFNAPPHDRDERRWILEQGPRSPDLLRALETDYQDYEVFLFFTYLYFPTVLGMDKVDRPIALFPTAHDEPPLYLKIMQRVFERPERLFFLTGAEQKLVQRVFGRSQGMDLVRTGITFPAEVDSELFRRKQLIFGSYMLYAGRIERGKGLEAVFDAYSSLRRHHLVDLVLLGRRLMEIPEAEGIRYAGYVSELEKFSAFRGAAFSLQPSSLESLSITTLESFAQGTPVLANRRSPALSEHVDLSGGGLLYADPAELVGGAERLLSSRRLRLRMGEKGRAYVCRYFDWEKVTQSIRAAILQLAGN
ncbi:MAG: glycosyltransferase family 4 protein [Candidatus Aminicenantes bacterium]|nr:glycosyltransferase family 4 protein [Candidatus Aminicenantes bacterium]